MRSGIFLIHWLSSRDQPGGFIKKFPSPCSALPSPSAIKTRLYQSNREGGRRTLRRFKGSERARASRARRGERARAAEHIGERSERREGNKKTAFDRQTEGVARKRKTNQSDNFQQGRFLWFPLLPSVLESTFYEVIP